MDNKENTKKRERLLSKERSRTMIEQLFKFIQELPQTLDIKGSSDAKSTIRNIHKNIEIKGYNIWILVCSAMLASIGLDTNSTAVIIGAMLISPLMSPILGVGLGLGINDREMLRHAIENLILATVASLLASMVYFTITPLGQPTGEIMSRTEPTLLDVLVAFFGGVAGIVSGSRNETTNAIPGVAIATALMPPLCAAGFGLATWRYDIFLGAFYLYFINAVFISISTFLIVKYLQFPLHKEPDAATRRKVNRIMAVSLIIVVMPSIYFLYSVWYRSQTIRSIDLLVQEITEKVTADEEHEVLNVERPRTTDDLKKMRSIKLYVSGDPVEDSIVAYYQQRLDQIGTYRLSISSLNNVSSEDVERLIDSRATQETVLEIKTRYADLQKQLDSIRTEQISLAAINITENLDSTTTKELQVFFPKLRSVKITDLRPPEERIKQQREANTKSKQEEGGTNKVYEGLYYKLKAKPRFPYLAITRDRDDYHKYLRDSLAVFYERKTEFPYFRIGFVADSSHILPVELATIAEDVSFPYFKLEIFGDSLRQLVSKEELAKADSANLAEARTKLPNNGELSDTASDSLIKIQVKVNIFWQSEFEELSEDEALQIARYLRLKLGVTEELLEIENFIEGGNIAAKLPIPLGDNLPSAGGGAGKPSAILPKSYE